MRGKMTGIQYISDFEFAAIHVMVGEKYYVTVTACNTADMCTSVTSDGIILDNSPPTPGVVMDGASTVDIHYQGDRSVIISI